MIICGSRSKLQQNKILDFIYLFVSWINPQLCMGPLDNLAQPTVFYLLVLLPLLKLISEQKKDLTLPKKTRSAIVKSTQNEDV